MQTIIGLGNPGEKYEKTRHNVGFIIMDELAKSLNTDWGINKKFKAAMILSGEMILVKPLTYMNNSGEAAQKVLAYYNLLPKKLGLFHTKDRDLAPILTVIHDDVDIDLGKYKITSDSRSAGHRGVQSIINHLKTQKFKRVRVGIRSSEQNKIPTEKFVLKNFRPDEFALVEKIIPEILKELAG